MASSDRSNISLQKVWEYWVLQQLLRKVLGFSVVVEVMGVQSSEAKEDLEDLEEEVSQGVLEYLEDWVREMVDLEVREMVDLEDE